MPTIPQAGIYAIRCRPNKKVYIGSAVHLRNRWNHHRATLRRGNNPSLLLQRAWNKYGEQSFEWVVLEAVDDPAQLIEREQAWLDFYRAYEPRYGYNVRTIADRNTGLVVTPETREKIRKSLTGRKASPNRKIPDMTAYWTAERRQQHGEAVGRRQKGQPFSTERRRSMSEKAKAAGKRPVALAWERSVAAKAKTFIVTHPDGREETFTNLRQWCRDNGVRLHGIARALYDRRVPTYKGMRIRHADDH